jgi:hypothetical protein
MVTVEAVSVRLDAEEFELAVHCLQHDRR